MRGSAMLHPAVLASMLLLIVNDHVLKHAYPGFFTGKLSDVAGLAFFPVLLWSLLEVLARRPPPLSLRACAACIVVTGLVFAATKTWPPAGEAYAQAIALLQWPVRALVAVVAGVARPALGRVSFAVDATDLLALPALALPFAIARARCGSRPPPQSP